MNWLVAADQTVFRWVNGGWHAPWLDALMVFASGNPLFAPTLLLIALALLWRGGARGRLCVLLLAVACALANTVSSEVLKSLFARPRPFLDLADARVLVGRTTSFSLPSSHAANWFAAIVVTAAFYRRSLRAMLPIALCVGLSRVYVGVHYPTDVLLGACVGALVGLATLRLAEAGWRSLGSRAFPIWWRHVPSLLRAEFRPDPLAFQPGVPALRDPAAAADRQWLALGYFLIAILLAAGLAYIASDTIEISKDEAYQWLWSKHLALSYFSKPPLIACFHFLSRTLWGDTAFGIRFFAPVMSAITSVLVLRFLAREVNTRVGFLALLVINSMPIMALGTMLFTIDSPNVLFWTAALVAGWKAVQREGTTRHWSWLGLWLGLGFLTKFTALLQWIALATFLALWRPARLHLRRPGPYVALAITALASLPVLIWNHQNGWITLAHLYDRAGLTESWRPTLRFFLEFTGAEWAGLNPVFSVALIWAVVAVWRTRRQNPLLLYLFAMGVPVCLGYWIYTARARVQPNWIVPAVVPLACLLVIHAEARWRAGLSRLRPWFLLGLILGLPAVVLAHESSRIAAALHRELPPKLDPLRRLRGWREATQTVDALRRELQTEGKPTFVICEHYGITALFTFYLPEAKSAFLVNPLIFVQTTDFPMNQFYFWPNYRNRTGQNAIYVAEAEEPQPPPDRIVRQFASVTDLGLRDIPYRGRVLRKLQFFACRDQH
jgi:4-amino-4-deoxy-L-arabinose transferase-like glycosyltransferase/membrane-associated phospholipid phosphatase